MQRSSKKIQRIFWASLLSLAIVMIPQLSHALTVQEVPNPRQINGGWVTDMANIISDNTEVELNRIISDLEAKNGTEIAVVTVPETAPSPAPKAFAVELFNYWKVGKKGEDNGVLFLVSVGDRRVEIETGYGVEGILPDAKVGNIIETKITPRFKQGDFDRGILAGTQALVNVLGGEISESQLPAETKDISGWLLGIIPGGILAAIAGLIASFKKHKKVVAIEPFGYSRISPDNKDSIYWLIYGSSLILIIAITPAFVVLAAIINPVLVLGIPGLAFVLCAWELGKKQKYLSVCGFILLGMVLAFVSSFVLLIILPEEASFILLFSFISLPSGIFAAVPLANILYQRLEAKKRLVCRDCGREMVKINREDLTPCFNPHQEKAEELKSLKYEGLQCPHCSAIGECKIHIRGHILSDRIYSDCPEGNELTVSRSEKILQSPTYSSEGRKLITYTCKCCDYRTEREETIPRLTRSSSSSSGSSSGGGGSSFGGGSSGGGGAGGSW